MAQMSESDLHDSSGEGKVDATRSLLHLFAEGSERDATVTDGTLESLHRDMLGHASVITTSKYLHATGSAITTATL